MHYHPARAIVRRVAADTHADVGVRHAVDGEIREDIGLGGVVGFKQD